MKDVKMRLSICIPTYNRGPELCQLLDSIVAQKNYTIPLEIVISDNASIDNTEEIVSRYITMGMNILYRRLTENRGFDRNVLNAVELATGEYCWLFGSDDLLEQEALAKIQKILYRHPQISAVSVGSQGYSSDLSHRVFVTDNISTTFSEETLLYGQEEPIAMIGPWMGFMTSMIVRRSLWQNAVYSTPIEPYLRGYVHLYVATKMLDAHSRWLCIPDRLVGCRTGNDSFLAKDEFARTRLDIEGFDLAFGDTLGRNNWAYRRAMSMVAGFFIRAHFVTAKMQRASWGYWRQAIPVTIRMYWPYSAYWIKAFPIALTPRSLLLLARYVHRHTRKNEARLERPH